MVSARKEESGALLSSPPRQTEQMGLQIHFTTRTPTAGLEGALQTEDL